MKKTFSLLFLSIFLYNIFGYYLVFRFLKFQNKSEIQTLINDGLSNDLLVVIKIPKTLANSSNTIFEKIDEKEFKYKGEMFDIVRENIIGDTIHFYCINDKQEKRLITNLDNHLKNHIDTDKSSPDESTKDIIKNIFKDYFLEKQEFCFYINIQNKYFSNPMLFNNSIFQKTDSPPPEIFV